MIPTTPGTTMTPISISRRMTSSGTKSCAGMRSNRKVPRSGTMNPATITIQMTDPNVIPSSRICRDAGTRPNRSVLAQPSAVVRTLLAKRDPKAMSAARIATATASRAVRCARANPDVRRHCGRLAA
jgi:hypothetical protein